MNKTEKSLPAGRQGFTLIELLVVIAIIGILASLVLVALGNARDKANDARVKSNISQLRTLAEQIYDNSGSSYATVADCFGAAAPAVGNCKGVETSVNALQTDLTAANGVADPGLTSVDSATTYCVQAVLKSTTDSFCADSTGVAKIVSAACTVGGACP